MEPAHVLYKREWCEPAHFLDRLPDLLRKPVAEAAASWGREVVPGVREPAHWFDPGFDIPELEKVLIAVIDEVYPELRLEERVVTARRAAAGKAMVPEVQEPVHLGKVGPELDTRGRDFMAELAALLKRYGY